jgi:hypothetical protein
MHEPDCLIHLGFYKAASTWLQKRYFLEPFGYSQAMDSLRLQLNFLDLGGPGYDAEATRADMAGQLLAIRQRGFCPVISSEGLSGDILRGGYNQADNARRMREVLGDGARILLVVREQRQLLRSAYKTLVYFGESRSIGQLLKPLSGDESPRFHPGFLFFDQLVALYQQLFSTEAVLVLPYELFKERPREFLNRIRNHAGLATANESHFSELPLKQKLNASEPLGYIEGQRLGNRLAGNARNDYQGRRKRNDFEQVIRRIAWHKNNSRPLPVDDWLEQRFVRQVEQLGSDFFSGSNRRLSELTGLDLAPYDYQ